LKNSFNNVFVREKVAIKLLNIANKLEKYGYGLCLYDGWRSYELQLVLYNNYLETIQKNNPKLKQEKIEKLATKFVSKPIKNDKYSFLHNTGGAIDLTLTKNGQILDMGTSFDAFSPKAYTNYYEKHLENDEIKNNRRILYNAMISEDFVNLPSEWWHYDYGDKVWASVKNKDVIYIGEDITKKGRIL
jgi:D-alanyl-D-alanine dipeptidase